jgi:hypothetical protein
MKEEPVESEPLCGIKREAIPVHYVLGILCDLAGSFFQGTNLILVCSHTF